MQTQLVQTSKWFCVLKDNLNKQLLDFYPQEHSYFMADNTSIPLPFTYQDSFMKLYGPEDAIHRAENARYRVLVFGRSGVGKTSMLDSILGLRMPVSGGVKGCTFETTMAVPVKNTEYMFFDTAGLNESSEGTVPSFQAIKGLIRLLKASRSGFNLLVMVHKAGRFDKTDKDNYQLFVETITAHKYVCFAL